MTAVKHTTESTFAKLGVRDEIVRALGEEGIKRPFAIQELTLPLALDGEDVIGQHGKSWQPNPWRYVAEPPARRSSSTATRSLSTLASTLRATASSSAISGAAIE